MRQDLPQLPTAEYTGEDVDRTRHFVRGMHERALGIGRAMIDLVDLSGRVQMLDVGAGRAPIRPCSRKNFQHCIRLYWTCPESWQSPVRLLRTWGWLTG